MPFRRMFPGPNWASASADDDGISDDTVAKKLKYHPRSKLMTYVTGGVTGSLRVSSDSGRNWEEATLPTGCDGCLDVVEASGALYGLFYVSSTDTAKVATSTDGMAWTVIYTHTIGHQAFNIAASGSKVAFIARNAPVGSLGTLYELVLALDGLDFQIKPIAESIMSDSNDIPLVAFTGGSILIYMAGDPVTEVFTRVWIASQVYDPDTDSWTILPEAPLSDKPIGNPAIDTVGALLSIDNSEWISTDALASFTNFAGPSESVGAHCFDAGGRLWILGSLDAYFSDDLGQSWAAAGAGVERFGRWNIAAHPTDQNKIVFTDSDEITGNWVAFITENRGVSWTVVDVAPVSANNDGVQGAPIWMENGTIIVPFENSGTQILEVYAGDLGGFSQVYVHPEGSVLVDVCVGAGYGFVGVLNLIDASSEILRSADGVTWVALPLPAEANGGLVAINYLAHTSTLYMLAMTVLPTGRRFYGVPDATISWSPISLTAPSVLPTNPHGLGLIGANV